jgi:hypothetical protein
MIMPDLDDYDRARNRETYAPASPAAPSRRAVLRVAAGAGVAGIATTALGGVLTRADAATRSGPGDGSAHTTAEDDGQPGDVVLHVRNVAAGEIDVFRGTTQIRLHDPDLAARVVRASR